MNNLAVKKIIEEFFPKDKKKLCLLVFFSVVVGLFEFFGLILIYQFVIFLVSAQDGSYSKIIFLFKDFLKIENSSLISLSLGVLVALIYIFKNIFFLFYTKFYNNILVDMSKKLLNRASNIFLKEDFLKINSISSADKLNILNKIDIFIWQYCLKYINLYSNLIIALIIVSYLFFKFTLVAILACGVISLFGGIEYLYLKRKSNFQNKNYSKALKACGANIFKIVTLIKEIKIASLEEYFENKTKENYDFLLELNKDKNFNNILHIYLTEIFIMMSFILVLFSLFFTSNFDNKVVISSLCTICVVILRLAPLINRIQSALYSINSNKKIAKEIISFFESFPVQKENASKNSKKEEISFSDKIILKNANFKYQKEDEFGLQNITLEIKKGEFIGIVGQSGCFKTTFLNILSGLIPLNSGKIIIDQKELNKENISSWQEKISYQAQDHALLFEDVLENFSFFNKSNLKEKDFKKIKEIFEKLGLEEKILNMKEFELSQGQKQRVCLALSIFQNKEILLLDEITSALDVFSQEKINEILKSLKGKKTIISIAHRLQALLFADRIIYLEDGKVIDFDNFKNLDKKYPKFHKIIQLSNFEIENEN